MTVLYEMTIFVAIALTAITVTVFVIAASLLGRAIEESSRKQEEVVREESSEFDKTIAGLQKRLGGAKKAEVIDDLKKQISEYEERKKGAEKELKRISQRYGLLTVKGTVLYPGLFLLISIVIAGTARYIATLPPVTGLDGTEILLVLIPGWIEDPILLFVANVAWGLSLLALAWGCYRICRCLKVIEGVAITTEEAQFKRTTKALEMALERHEESKLPRLKLEFEKGKPPFNFKPGVEEIIEFSVDFEQGDIAKGVEAWFFAPEGFIFPGSKTWYQSSSYSIPNALTTRVKLGEVRRWFRKAGKLTIKTPSETGEYRLRYQMFCEDSRGDFITFKIKVK
jgi:hypothetical protein